MVVGWILLLFTITSSLVRGLTRYNPYTCYDISTREYYCCSNYEEIHGECIECKIGFNSRNGSACKLCSLNSFGKGCSQECYCNDLQRCNRVKGCVDIETTSALESNSNSAEDISTEGRVTLANKDEHHYCTGISKTELLMLYSGASSGIIVLLGMLGILYCFKKRICNSKSRHVETAIKNVQNATRHVKQETPELQERFYEEIDESRLESILNLRTHIPNLTNDQESSTSACTANFNFHIKNDKCQIEVPFVKKSTKMVVDQGSCSFYKTTEEDSSSSDGTVDCNYDRTSYLHPYNTLSTKKSYSHSYESAKNVGQSIEESN